ncbi:MAG TPA: hypothetical protein VFP68_02165 [Burkholderiaceae bacterium]|nr:hypothetical protein [Burkholderiaceae bacterium]
MSVEVQGLGLEVAEDGTLTLRLHAARVRDVSLAAGSLSVSFAQAAARGIELRLSRGRQLLSLSIDDIEVLELQAGFDADAVASLRRLSGPWRLDAVAGADGRLDTHIADAAWVIDADVALPINQGRIDFDRVVVEHVGPNSAMGISRGGLYVDAPRLGRSYLVLFTADDVPGAEFEQRSEGGSRRVLHRGRLDIAALLEALLSTPTLGRAASAKVQAQIDRTWLAGEVRLGDGMLGTEGNHLVLTGRGEDMNVMSVSAAALSELLDIGLRRLRASSATATLAGSALTCDAVNADLEVRVRGLKGDLSRMTGSAKIGRLELQKLRVAQG